MNGYERALRTLRFEATDCVPTFGGWIVSAGFFEYVTGRRFWDAPRPVAMEAYRKLGADMVFQSLYLPAGTEEWRTHTSEVLDGASRFRSADDVVAYVASLPEPDRLESEFDFDGQLQSIQDEYLKLQEELGADILCLPSCAGTRFTWYMQFGYESYLSALALYRLIEYVRSHPGDVSIAGHEQGDSASLAKAIEQRVSLRFSGFAAARERAMADDPAFEMTGRGPDHTFVFLYEQDGCGMHWVHSAEWRLSRLDDPLHLSRTIAEMRKRQWLTHKLFRGYVSGFEQAHLMDIHPHIARALLRSQEPGGLVEYDVPGEHIAENGTLYEDAIARVRGHHDTGEALHGWQLPYRSLIPKELEGLLVTGKAACRSLHIHSTNAAVGQAAGVAAAVAVKAGVALRDTPVVAVQEELKRQRAVVF